MTDDKRQLVRRLTAVTLAVALGVGAVGLMRLVARELAGVDGAAQSHVRRVAVESGPNAPRVYDLGALIVGDLRYSVMGHSGRRQQKNVLTPFALALRESDETAKAAGWKPFQSPDPKVARYMRFISSYMYEKPDGRLVCRRYQMVTSAETKIIEIELPGLKDYYDSYDPASMTGLEKMREFDLYAFVEPTARRLRRCLPRVIDDIVVGLPSTSALMTRGTGHVFELITLERGNVESVERRICRLLLEHGWRTVPESVGMYEKENLSVCFRCMTEVELVDTVVVSYRISDDEVRINQQRSENEN